MTTPRGGLRYHVQNICSDTLRLSNVCREEGVKIVFDLKFQLENNSTVQKTLLKVNEPAKVPHVILNR